MALRMTNAADFKIYSDVVKLWWESITSNLFAKVEKCKRELCYFKAETKRENIPY